jgi:hypothetical protein
MTGETLALLLLAAVGARAADWSPPVEVRHDDEVAVSYQAKLDGAFLVVRAALAPGWHTFAMDNQKRANEKLAGKTAISVDRETEIVPAGLEIAGPWYQSAPKDFSHPELRWFSWGFEGQALFAAKIRRSPSRPATLKLRGQACTATICKNIDVAIALPAGTAKAGDAPSAVNIKDLTQVR